MNIYLLKNFNNYFNRQVKLLSSLQNYLDAVKDYFSIEDFNFKPNDGITTNVVIGSGNKPYDKDWQPDYCLVVDDDDNIVSRWYVIESDRSMGKQYVLSLKRDSIADKYSVVLGAPCYIEKAPLRDGDVQLVNSEGISVNQIKDGEYFLKDETRVPWVVCYLNQKRKGEERQGDATGYKIDAMIEKNTGIPELADDVNASEIFLQGGQLSKDVTVKEYHCDYAKIDLIGFGWYYLLGIPGFLGCFGELRGDGAWYYEYNATWGFKKVMWWSGHNPEFNWFAANHLKPVMEKFLNNYYWQVVSLICNEYGTNGHEYNVRTRPRPYVQDGKVYHHNGSYYKVHIEQSGGLVKDAREWSSTSAISDLLVQAARDAGTGDGRAGERENPIVKNVGFYTYKYTLEQVQASGGYVHTFIKNDSDHCLNVPYDIFAMPLGEVKVYRGSQILCPATKYNVALEVAREMAVKMTNQEVYDIQIMPFCPCTGLNDKDGYSGRLVDSNGDINLTNYVELETYGFIKNDNNEIVNIYFMALNNHRTFNINHVGTSIYSKDQILISTLTSQLISNRKLTNECTIERLCSPNYDGMFEFNISKMVPLNKPFFEKFNIDIDYKAYNPYIHVNPDFGFLYGKDYNDTRGLICQGNFGITTMSDKWQEYQINNKNYLQMFNREIQNMETNRNIAREKEQWDLGWDIADLLKGQLFDTAMAGAKGFMNGGGAGAAIGATNTGVNTLYSGIKNITTAKKQMQWNQRAYDEQRDFKTDMFKMQLDNIRAIPRSIANSSTLTQNFKFFPLLEHYTCTDLEMDIVRNKMKYNGMTVGRIATIGEFLHPTDEVFIKGQIIRLEDTNEDSHIAQDIYNEVNKGLFFVPMTENYLKNKVASGSGYSITYIKEN